MKKVVGGALANIYLYAAVSAGDSNLQGFGSSNDPPAEPEAFGLLAPQGDLFATDQKLGAA